MIGTIHATAADDQVHVLPLHSFGDIAGLPFRKIKYALVDSGQVDIYAGVDIWLILSTESEA
jgi:hypothetical protein